MTLSFVAPILEDRVLAHESIASFTPEYAYHCWLPVAHGQVNYRNFDKALLLICKFILAHLCEGLNNEAKRYTTSGLQCLVARGADRGRANVPGTALAHVDLVVGQAGAVDLGC